MKKILIFAGTTEGRQLSEILCENRWEHYISVATDYGVQMLTDNAYAHILQGRMDEEEIAEFVKKNQIQLVVDATHPYARIVTENIRKALDNTGVELWRLARNLQQAEGEQIYYFQDSESCAGALKQVEGTIFLTTGSKELFVYAEDEEVRKRLVVRVLPGLESLELCQASGIPGKQIVAMQGPFSVEMNVALMRQYHVGCLVTKQSGKNGGFSEKIQAAEILGIPVFVIGAPREEKGLSLEEVCEGLGLSFSMKIQLIGCGMGGEGSLTREAYSAIHKADILLGAPRLIQPYRGNLETKPYYLSKDILPYLLQLQERQTQNLSVGILFSGDTGFYSGAKKLLLTLDEAIAAGRLRARVDVLPGISSVSYLAAALQESWEDAKIVSVHGKGEASLWMDDLMETITREKKTFVLLSGEDDVRALGENLLTRGMREYELWVGYHLSYPDERVFRYEVFETKEEQPDGKNFFRHRGKDLPKGLYCCLIKNV